MEIERSEHDQIVVTISNHARFRVNIIHACSSLPLPITSINARVKRKLDQMMMRLMIIVVGESMNSVKI